jgi:curli biogenesis system outer membrane secretion channel CsgG
MALWVPAPVQGDTVKTKIAVLDFELCGDKFSTDGLGSMVAEWFVTALVKDGRFEVIERAMLQKIITEQ